jgi:DNA-directed RNA polymerases I, II, and III subunit RPABC2
MEDQNDDINIGIDDEFIDDEGDLELLDNEIEEETFFDDGNRTVKILDPNDSKSHPTNSLPSEGPRITSPYMTKFEKARIIGTRALQIR